MTQQMTCDDFAERLSDFLARELDESTRIPMEQHARSCAACGTLVADLRALRINASSLPVLTPSRDLWSGIAARIETPVVELTDARNVAPASRRVDRRVWLGLAAAGLVAVTATVTRELTKQPSAIVPAANMAATATPQRTDTGALSAIDTARVSVPRRPATSLVANNPAKLSAEQTYDHEIGQLLVIVDRRRSDLDSSTVAVINRNLRIIDDAIAQCRTALKTDPASRFLMESLDGALDTKVHLLRTAAMLPART